METATRELSFGRKRGRPKKVQDPAPKEAPKVETQVEPQAPPPLTAAQQAEIDRIMDEAKQKAESVILGGAPMAQPGTPSGNIEDKTAEIQRDFIPGKFRKDKTHIPTHVHDREAGVTRQVLRPPDEVRYCLITADDFTTYIHGLGYRFALYDGGSQSGLLGKGFQGTDNSVVIRELNGTCRRGDCFLVWIHTRGWEALAEEDREKSEKKAAAAVGAFHNQAYNYGIRPYGEMKNQDGVTTDLFNTGMPK